MKKEYRFLSDGELINCVVNDNAFQAQTLSSMSFDTVIEKLTPARRQLAESIIELYKRSLHQVSERPQIRGSFDVFNLMNPVLSGLAIEEFWIVALNQSGKVIDKVHLSIGGLAGTFVDVRVLVKELLKLNATQCAILQNHPSGNLQPSNEDINLTKKIKQATDLLNIRLIDHVIIGHDKYYSFADEGMIYNSIS